MSNYSILVGMYRTMSDEKIQEEIDSIFEIVHAILTVTESDSIEVFPEPNIKLKISYEEIKKDNNYIC